MKISVIFTTYNSPEWLEKVLWGFHYQSDGNFEVIIADDGSTDETSALINSFSENSHLDIKHVWHEDDGFQKCKIMNKAILASTGEYIIFTDGDCIPRSDFVAAHRSNSTPGFYLSGGYFKLPMVTSKEIDQKSISSGDAFDVKWLTNHGLKKTLKSTKLTAKGFVSKLLNKITTTRRTWNGHNSSVWKSNILEVNGFDERMQYGGEDCEFGDRLRFSGLKAKQIRYSAICVHLDHARGYVNEEMLAKNLRIRKETKKNKPIETQHGIKQRS